MLNGENKGSGDLQSPDISPRHVTSTIYISKSFMHTSVTMHRLLQNRNRLSSNNENLELTIYFYLPPFNCHPVCILTFYFLSYL